MFQYLWAGGHLHCVVDTSTEEIVSIFMGEGAAFGRVKELNDLDPATDGLPAALHVGGSGEIDKSVMSTGKKK